MRLPGGSQKQIPVALSKPRLGSGDSFVDCAPIINVHVACDAAWSIHASIAPTHNGKLYGALIDTGAEDTVISEKLAADIGVARSNSAILHGFDGKQTVEGAMIQVLIPCQNIVFAGRAAITDLQQAGHMFSIVLGRSFLEHCRLEIDGPACSYKLWWVQ